MSITERMENDGMTFQDAVDKEAGVSGAAPPPSRNDLVYIKARLQEIKDREPHSKLLQVEALMVLELIAAQDRRFSEHLAAWIANAEYHAKQIHQLESLCAAQEKRIEELEAGVTDSKY